LPKELAQVTDIFDRNGELLYVKHTSGEIRTVVPLEQVSPNLINATVALEDHAFFQHHGINPYRIAAAAYQDITHKRIEQGGSTITQQLVKTSFFAKESRSYDVKIKEVLMALELERRYTKKEILTLYLNQIFYGRQAYGAEVAAQTYFGHPAKALTVAEAAMLAGLPQQPSRLDPLNPKTLPAARARQELVLRAMRTHGYLTDGQLQEALAEKLNFNQRGTIESDLKAPHFVNYVLEELTARYGRDVVESGGLRVYTSLDYNLQQQAEEFTRQEVALQQERGKNVNTAAMVAIDPRSGEILAMVGSPNYGDKQLSGEYNAVTGLPGRQPGSSFKLYVYAAAFSNGYTAATVLNDRQFQLGAHYFHNWDGQSRGPITLRVALRDSRNIPPIRIMQQLGPERVTATARALGLTTPIDPVLASAIGGSAVQMLEHVNAYAVLASGGMYHRPTAILKVVDGEGKVLEEHKPDAGVRVLNPQVAYLITDILRPVCGQLRIGRDFACKTGTTDEWKDSWLIGFSPDIVVGAWMAHKEPDGAITPMNVVWGVEGAGQIVRDVFNLYEQNRPEQRFQQPAGMVRATVCKPSGLKPTPLCGSNVVTELFVQGTAPTKDDDWYKQVRVCHVDGKLAPPDAPDTVAENRTYLVYPSDYPAELRDPGNPPVPTEPCSIYSRTVPPVASIVQPPRGGSAVIGRVVPITVNAEEPGGAVKEVILTISARDSTWRQQVHLTDPTAFTYKWETRGRDPGSYLIQAQAVDYANLYSQVVSIPFTLTDVGL
jgi:membrane peptidoglycan carboxypeptidase